MAKIPPHALPPKSGGGKRNHERAPDKEQAYTRPVNVLTDDMIFEVLEGSGGIVATIAGRLGVSRVAIYDHMNANPALKSAVMNERETVKDYVESKILKAIDDGNLTAMIFWAKSKMPERGYVDRQVIGGGATGDKEITLRVIHVPGGKLLADDSGGDPDAD